MRWRSRAARWRGCAAARSCGPRRAAALAAAPAASEPAYDPAELYGIIPPSSRKPYDVRELIARLVDRFVVR